MFSSVGTFWVSLAPILLPIVVGAVLGRASQRIDDRSVATCLLYFFLPIYLLVNLTKVIDGSNELGLVFFFLFFHTAALWVLSASTLKLLHLPQRTHSLVLLTVLLSHPYLVPAQIFYVVAGNSSANAIETAYRIFEVALVSIAVVGMYLGSQESSVTERLFEMIRLPIAPLAILAFLLGLLGVSLSPAILSILTPASQGAMPLTFLLLGIMIGRGLYLFELLSLTQMLVAVAIAAVLRLILSPVIAFLLIKVMPIEPSLGRLLVIHTAMPTAAFASIFVAFYGQPPDKRYVALCILITGIISCITIPSILALLAP
ncbi:MAG: hypothetical protein ABIH23_30835 [bacterium]